MNTKILLQYKSRRNCAQLIQTDDDILIRKMYQQPKSYRQELQAYELLQGSSIPHAELVCSREQLLMLTLLPGRDLVEILEQQETTGVVNWTVWDKLADWLSEFYRVTGLVMQDVNLRNFLYDDQTGTLYGLDFEECGKGDPLFMAALLAAYIQTYAPENTPLKQEISDYVLQSFSRQLGIPFQALTLETKKQEAFLHRRRKSRT